MTRNFSRIRTVLGAALLLSMAGTAARAEIAPGGGALRRDCIAVFDATGANRPAPPRLPRRVVCEDGDPACDTDGLRNGRCVFELELCVNSTAVPGCTPESAEGLIVDHAEDNGDPRFDPDFQALQQRADVFLGLPNEFGTDVCTPSSSVTVVLRGRPAASPRPLERESWTWREASRWRLPGDLGK